MAHDYNLSVVVVGELYIPTRCLPVAIRIGQDPETSIQNNESLNISTYLIPMELKICKPNMMTLYPA
jgi:hypothetical protein